MTLNTFLAETQTDRLVCSWRGRDHQPLQLTTTGPGRRAITITIILSAIRRLDSHQISETRLFLNRSHSFKSNYAESASPVIIPVRQHSPYPHMSWSFNNRCSARVNFQCARLSSARNCCRSTVGGTVVGNVRRKR